MANLQVTPYGPFTEHSELNFRGLYLHHISLGPKPTQSTVVSDNPATGLGEITVNNWPIYDGPGPYANVVAQAQGLHVHAAGWHNSFTVVFQDARFRGSTLQVMGLSVEEGDWSIVGGTGHFAMARGIISKRLQQQRNDGNIIELTIHGFCPILRGSQPMGMGQQQQYPGSQPMGTRPQQYPGTQPMGFGPQPYPEPQQQMGMGPQQYPGTNPMGTRPQQYPGQQPIGMGPQQYPGQYPIASNQAIRNGPWGGSGGSPRDITDAPRRLESVTIRSGWVIDSLAFSYIDQAGQRRTAGPWGGSGGGDNTIYLAPSEFVTEVSGTTGAHDNHVVVRSLKIVTNMRTYGPFGREQNDASTPFSSRGAIVGFFGRSGDNLDSIGTYTI